MTENNGNVVFFDKNRGASSDKTQSLRNQVYEHICQKMHRGDLLPGSIVDPKQICEELGISRTPLNNALIRLDAEGIVTIHPRSRVVVNKLELEDIHYLYEVIGAIESTLITNGFHNYTPEVLDQMEAWNKEMQEHIMKGDLRAYDRPHYQYHETLIMMAPNKFAERILHPIKNRLWDIPKKSFPQQWYLDACSEHQVVIDALREKDLEKAVSTQKNVHWGFEFNKKYIQMAYYL